MTTSTTALSATGSFNHAALASARRFDASEVLGSTPILGLVPEAGYIWGTFRDDDGGLHSTMRRIPAKVDPEAAKDAKSLGGKLIHLSSTDKSEPMQLRRGPRHAPDSNEITRKTTDSNSVEMTGPENEHGRSMNLTIAADFVHYNETDVIDVTGTPAAPPLQWYLPGPQSSLLYVTQTWLVEGQLDGKHVRGFLFWEEARMPEGGRLYVHKDPLDDAEYTTWYSWANQYEDGSSEVGHFVYGNGDCHVGVIGHSDGTVTSARTMEASVSRDSGGYWHTGIDYVLDGEAWRLDANIDGRMEGLGKMPNPQQEGRMHRVADTREPSLWMAWGESVPGHGEQRQW